MSGVAGEAVAGLHQIAQNFGGSYDDRLASVCVCVCLTIPEEEFNPWNRVRCLFSRCSEYDGTTKIARVTPRWAPQDEKHSPLSSLSLSVLFSTSVPFVFVCLSLFSCSPSLVSFPFALPSQSLLQTHVLVKRLERKASLRARKEARALFMRAILSMFLSALFLAGPCCNCPARN